MHGSNAAAVIFRLNPIVRGWPAYYRSVVSGRIFTGLDHHVWHLTYRWARRSHPNKSSNKRVGFPYRAVVELIMLVWVSGVLVGGLGRGDGVDRLVWRWSW